MSSAYPPTPRRPIIELQAAADARGKTMATYKEFQEALAADEELRARCIELAKGFDPEDEEEAPEAMSQIAAKLGFDVPASEFRQAAQAGRELGDDELDAVAGGSTLFRIVSGYPLEKRRGGVANWY